jgi:ParB-like chromosome segregation protein Spo0J
VTKKASAINWPADKVERRKVSKLVPYAKNSRTHSDQQIDQIAASITEWGFANPVLIGEDGTIIAGHGRVLAASSASTRMNWPGFAMSGPPV